MHTRAIGGRYLTGNFAPIWTKSDAHWLPVTGELPKGLEGTLFRNGPNPQFWPTSPHHHWFGGDGMIHAFTIEKGRVRYRNRWVRAPKWQAENAAGHPLFDPFGPPDPNVAGSDGSLDCVANTNIIAHAGRLLAFEEAHLPVNRIEIVWQRLAFTTLAVRSRRPSPRIPSGTLEPESWSFSVTRQPARSPRRSPSEPTTDKASWSSSKCSGRLIPAWCTIFASRSRTCCFPSCRSLAAWSELSRDCLPLAGSRSEAPTLACSAAGPRQQACAGSAPKAATFSTS